MTIKKKLGLGVASAALGLSLVGGGTWAAFNDTATINNHFAAGTLDLEVGKVATKAINFDLTNMKPGDSVKRVFELKNAGTLAIKEVLLDTTTDNFDGGTDSLESEFLSQFEIDIFQIDNEDDASNNYPKGTLVENNQTLTLADLVNNTYSGKVKAKYLSNGKINLAPLAVDPGEEGYRGIPNSPVDSDKVVIEIRFKNDPDKVAGTNEYVQNKYMDDSVDFFFNLEATQWSGVEVRSQDGNGKVNNGVQGSADDTTTPVTQPNPRTTGDDTHTEEVTD
ncbi:TasA family protein [Bacillus sp. AK031]